MMAQTFSKLTYHGVFSTKGRRPLLNPDILPELAKVIGGIIRDRDGKLLAMNGTPDHVHLLMSLAPKHAASDIFRDIKSISSDWLHTRGAVFRTFAWQGGYSVFSVSESAVDQVAAYIARQETHHRTMSFEEELVGILERHGIDYNRQYLLG
jgi:putative transposase